MAAKEIKSQQEIASAPSSTLKIRSKSETFCVIFPLENGGYTTNGATPWWSEIKIGTPTQLLGVMIDTGTDNTWVTSCECTTQACKAHKCFDYEKSNTFEKVNFKVEPKDFGPWGKMEVKIGNDLFTLCQRSVTGEDVDICTRERLNFELAVNYEGEQFEKLKFDGGLAVPSPYWKKDPELQSLLLRLYKDNIIAYRAVAFSVSEDRQSGECLFGAMNPDMFQIDTLQWLPLKTPLIPAFDYLWNVKLDSFKVNGQEPSVAITDFVLDTGSSWFKGPKDLINDLIALVTENGTLPREVSSLNELGQYSDIELHLGDQVYLLTPEQYFLQVEPSKWMLGFNVLKGMPEGMLLVGSLFLDTVYSIFDYEDKSIGLAVPK